MPASEYSKTLTGLTINLLVKEIEPAVGFAKEILGAKVVYSDPDFAVMSAYGAEWMLHADHTYDKHPMGRTVLNGTGRGAGAEIRLHGCDPDSAEEALPKDRTGRFRYNRWPTRWPLWSAVRHH